MSTEEAQQAALAEARAQGRREGLEEAAEHLRLSGWVCAMMVQGIDEPVARAALALLAASFAEHAGNVRAERFVQMLPDGRVSAQGHAIEWEALRKDAPEILALFRKQVAA